MPLMVLKDIRFMFGVMTGFSAIMLEDSFFDIACNAGVVFIREVGALKDVDLFQVPLQHFAFRLRQGAGGTVSHLECH